MIASIETYYEPIHYQSTLPKDGFDLQLTQESNAPIVQMGDNHAKMNVQPVGHVVIFSTSANMK